MVTDVGTKTVAGRNVAIDKVGADLCYMHCSLASIRDTLCRQGKALKGSDGAVMLVMNFAASADMIALLSSTCRDN